MNQINNIVSKYQALKAGNFGCCHEPVCRKLNTAVNGENNRTDEHRQNIIMRVAWEENTGAILQDLAGAKRILEVR